MASASHRLDLGDLVVRLSMASTQTTTWVWPTLSNHPKMQPCVPFGLPEKTSPKAVPTPKTKKQLLPAAPQTIPNYHVLTELLVAWLPL